VPTTNDDTHSGVRRAPVGAIVLVLLAGFLGGLATVAVCLVLGFALAVVRVAVWSASRTR
jgi:hypothetical protein